MFKKLLATTAFVLTAGMLTFPVVIAEHVVDSVEFASLYFTDIKNTDAMGGVIRDVVMVTSGKNLNDSTFTQETMASFIDYSNKHTIRAFLGHEWTQGSIHTHQAIGYYKNIRLITEGTDRPYIVGDLHVYAKERLSSWYNNFLSQIKHLGGSGIGLSVVIYIDKKVTMVDGKPKTVLFVKRWASTDIVQVPAATENLFTPLTTK